MELQNSGIRIRFHERTGGIVSLFDPQRGIEYVSLPYSQFNETFTPVFRMDVGNGLREYAPDLLYAKRQADGALEMGWETPEHIRLDARVWLADGDARFTFKVDNRSSLVIRSVEYPLVSGIRRIAGQGRDFLAHSYGTGVLVRDPYAQWTFDNQGFRLMPYPESFSGCSMSYFTYYGVGKGGLYFAAYDSDAHLKWLNFYCMQQYLEASHILGNECLEPGQGLEMSYPFVVGFTAGNDWYEAADRYRAWAVEQPWCAAGPKYARPDSQRSKWLLENVGACTFGINSGSDRTAWLRQYHRDVGTPIFHVLGADWTREPQTYGFGEPGGMNDWFPTRFCAENLAAIRQQGDYAAAFEFDFLADLGKDDSDAIEESLMKFPAWQTSFDDYHFRILCPTCAYTRKLHKERDLRLLRDAGMNAVYYDVSSNNLLYSCQNERHDHKPGAGKEISAAFRQVFAETKAALCEQEKTYVPSGTELINEIFLGELDYYQARSWALPCSSLEFWPVRALFTSGAAEPIPMFTYTYSQYAPLRMDGWGKLCEETGELYYFIVARVYLWGGLYEINQEFSPMEELCGQVNPPEEHYFRFTPRRYPYSEDRARYLRQFAGMRVGELNPYLAYGRMLPPPETDAKPTTMGYYHYNHGQGDPSYEQSGEATVPSVMASAWRAPDNRSVAVLLANVSGREQRIHVRLDAGRYGMSGAWRCKRLGCFEPGQPAAVRPMNDARAEEGIALPVTLASRELCAMILEPME